VRTTRNDLLDAVLVGWSEQDRTDLLRLLDRLLDGVRDSMPAHPNPEN